MVCQCSVSVLSMVWLDLTAEHGLSTSLLTESKLLFLAKIEAKSLQKSKYSLAILLVALLITYWATHSEKITSSSAVVESTSQTANYSESQLSSHANNPSHGNNPELLRAFEQRKSNIWLVGSGEVSKILPDDNKGSRHQRFIVKVNLTQTILIAHNIDLAQRVANLQPGDKIQFYGEYEWNDKGGVIHWTHHDPSDKKTGGWIKHNEIIYQ
jgi:preprotein translocase subunit SecG